MAATMEGRKVARVILDNDFAGDPDGLFQLAHHALCRSVDIPLIVGSHLPDGFSSGHDASDGAARARELLKLMTLDGRNTVIAGSETAMRSKTSWTPSPATSAIVREAMRSDVSEPLFYAAGAGLTELALAWLAEPRIGQRVKLIWIGGNEHEGLANPIPQPDEVEFNLSIDPVAAQVIFNESDIEIWQVPRDAYRQMLFSNTEVDELAASGALGRYLKERLDAMAELMAKIPGFPGITQTEAYVLGDSPLVTLTALVPPFQPDPSSSRYKQMPTPKIRADGTYIARPTGRPMRVYTDIDAKLTFRDMLAKFRTLRIEHPGQG
ncbi:twin-arginine translocation pathway signal protein [Sphingobium lactosutens]|nr:nucleoside hydrolase [Sphingobium lactosutens]NWK95903.1 twin-arginine translocation pathway signal protein [Sphingobium lactosutens]